jgi:signal transduction histidine kinase
MKWLKNIDGEQQDPEEFDRIFKVKFLRLLLIVSVPLFSYYAFLSHQYGARLEFFLNLSCAIIMVAAIFLALAPLKPTKARISYKIAAYLYFSCLFILHFRFCMNGMIVYYWGWCFVYLILTFFVLGLKQGFAFALIYFITIISASLFFNRPPQHDLGEAHSRIETLTALMITALIAFSYELARYTTQQNLIRNQAKLRESEAQSRRALKTLKETQSQLLQVSKLASLGELSAGIAHELNQPLMVIRSNGQLMQRAFRRDDIQPEMVGEQLMSIDRNTKRMMNIINHLKTFSRQSSKKFEIIDMNKVIQDSLLIIGEQLRLRGIEVRLNLSPEIPKVPGEPNMVEQVVLNLLSNARGAIEEKKRKAGSEAGAWIEVDTGLSGDETKAVVVLIKDSGAGISPKDLGRIFDPFFTTKNVGEGTGLGLSISYGIIKEHGGEIEVIETGPEGTVFKISIPVEQSSSREDEYPGLHAQPEANINNS